MDFRLSNKHNINKISTLKHSKFSHYILFIFCIHLVSVITMKEVIVIELEHDF